MLPDAYGKSANVAGSTKRMPKFHFVLPWDPPARASLLMQAQLAVKLPDRGLSLARRSLTRAPHVFFVAL